VLKFRKCDLLVVWWRCFKLPNLYLSCEFCLSGSPPLPPPSLPLRMPMCSFNTQRSAGELGRGKSIWLSAHPVTYATYVQVYFWSRLGESSKRSHESRFDCQSGCIRPPTSCVTSLPPHMHVAVNLCSPHTVNYK
jgi:hypothetical protein